LGIARKPTSPAFISPVDVGSPAASTSYGPNLVDVYHLVGVYCGRIVRGEKAADLPVQQPTKYSLLINLNTAKALRLTIPDKLLALADEVSE
jgi:putative ABC transport system substrate-binding protein